MKKINLVYWRADEKWDNFGDALSRVIVERLINKDKYELVFNEPNVATNLIAVGSSLQFARDGYYIYGTGVRVFNQPKHYTTLNVSAVRGPITRHYLSDYHGIPCPDVYGDPALLISRFYMPKNIPHLNDKIGFVPHYSRQGNHKQCQFYVINPCDDWNHVMDQIYSCKYIISSSLHGLICADAYCKPNLWLDENIEGGNIKFCDYFLSQGRQETCITSLDHFNEDLLYRGGNIVNLDALERAFPFQQ